jgi:hypothetical protein
LEIYNEEIRDLLATEKNLKYDIKMCDTKGSDIYVTNLKVVILLLVGFAARPCASRNCRFVLINTQNSPPIACLEQMEFYFIWKGKCS